MASLGRSPGAAPLTSADIPDNSITAAKIVDATIAAGDLAPNSVDSSELVDGSIDASHLASNIAISTSGAITTTGAFTSIGIDDNADALAMTIDSSENVGIGETAPGSALHISSHDAGAAGPVLTLEHDSGSPADGDVIGKVRFLADNDSGGSEEWAHIRAEIADKRGSEEDGKLIFSTVVVDIDTDTMTLHNGNVGIGTTSPDQIFEIAKAMTGVAGSKANQPILRITQSADQTSYNIGDVHSGIEFYSEETNVSFPQVQAFIKTVTTRGDGIGNADVGLSFGTTHTDAVVSEKMIITHDGKVGLGTSAPRLELEISNPGAGVGQIIGGPDQEFWLHSDQHLRYIADSDGDGVHAHIWYIDGMAGSDEVMRIANDGVVTIGAGTVTSDERLKENITTITGGLEKINALTGRTFTWKEEADMQAGTHYGLIAQELEDIVPDLVYNKSGIRSFDVNGNLKTSTEFLETDEYAKSISIEGLIPVLIEAVKELSAKVTALESA